MLAQRRILSGLFGGSSNQSQLLSVCACSIAHFLLAPLHLFTSVECAAAVLLLAQAERLPYRRPPASTLGSASAIKEAAAMMSDAATPSVARAYCATVPSLYCGHVCLSRLC